MFSIYFSLPFLVSLVATTGLIERTTLPVGFEPIPVLSSGITSGNDRVDAERWTGVFPPLFNVSASAGDTAGFQAYRFSIGSCISSDRYGNDTQTDPPQSYAVSLRFRIPRENSFKVIYAGNDPGCPQPFVISSIYDIDPASQRRQTRSAVVPQWKCLGGLPTFLYSDARLLLFLFLSPTPQLVVQYNEETGEDPSLYTSGYKLLSLTSAQTVPFAFDTWFTVAIAHNSQTSFLSVEIVDEQANTATYNVPATFVRNPALAFTFFLGVNASLPDDQLTASFDVSAAAFLTSASTSLLDYQTAAETAQTLAQATQIYRYRGLDGSAVTPTPAQLPSSRLRRASTIASLKVLGIGIGAGALLLALCATLVFLFLLRRSNNGPRSSRRRSRRDASPCGAAEDEETPGGALGLVRLLRAAVARATAPTAASAAAAEVAAAAKYIRHDLESCGLEEDEDLIMKGAGAGPSHSPALTHVFPVPCQRLNASLNSQLPGELAEFHNIDEAALAPYLLGRGGYGNVYRVPLADGRSAALKVFSMHVASGGAASASAAAFYKELGLLSSLRHPLIVSSLGHGSLQGDAQTTKGFILMELAPGLSVRSWLYPELTLLVPAESGPEMNAWLQEEWAQATAGLRKEIVASGRWQRFTGLDVDTASSFVLDASPLGQRLLAHVQAGSKFAVAETSDVDTASIPAPVVVASVGPFVFHRVVWGLEETPTPAELLVTSVRELSAELPSLPLKIRARIALQTAEGLAYLHSRNLVHADIKPCNILLDADLHVKIGDVGLSFTLPDHVSHISHLGRGGPTGATRGYIDPERTNLRAQKFGGRNDMYALGITMLELFADDSAAAAPFLQRVTPVITSCVSPWESRAAAAEVVRGLQAIYRDVFESGESGSAEDGDETLTTALTISLRNLLQ